MEGLDLETIRHALGVAKAHGLSEVQVQHGEDTFTAVFEGSPARPASGKRGGAAAAVELLAADELAIPSPFVGYYRANDPPLRAGQRVERGEIVASIAALGLAHDVESPLAGEIVEVLVEPGQAVQYGQPLAKVR